MFKFLSINVSQRQKNWCQCMYNIHCIYIWPPGQLKLGLKIITMHLRSTGSVSQIIMLWRRIEESIHKWGEMILFSGGTQTWQSTSSWSWSFDHYCNLDYFPKEEFHLEILLFWLSKLMITKTFVNFKGWKCLKEDWKSSEFSPSLLWLSSRICVPTMTQILEKKVPMN